ncbi:hypothetical protein ACFLQV_02735 [Calditrichota bacterium]
MADERWLTSEALDLMSHQWHERILVIMEDLSKWTHLRYAFAIGRDGIQLTHPIGPKGTILDEKAYSHEIFHHLALTVEEYLVNIEHPAPAYVTIELEHELLFVASTGAVYLVASFEDVVERGYMSMKLKKRIAHLRNVSQQYDRGRVG